MRLFLFIIFSVGALLGRFPADTPPALTPPADTPPPMLETMSFLGTGLLRTSRLDAETLVVLIGDVGISDSPLLYAGWSPRITPPVFFFLGALFS